jgi:hypothetical protein
LERESVAGALLSVFLRVALSLLMGSFLLFSYSGGRAAAEALLPTHNTHSLLFGLLSFSLSALSPRANSF